MALATRNVESQQHAIGDGGVESFTILDVVVIR